MTNVFDTDTRIFIKSNIDICCFVLLSILIVIIVK